MENLGDLKSIFFKVLNWEGRAMYVFICIYIKTDRQTKREKYRYIQQDRQTDRQHNRYDVNSYRRTDRPTDNITDMYVNSYRRTDRPTDNKTDTM